MISHTQIVIIGGGLAGLTAAIHLAKAGISVILIEKDTYPRHKVCGEYISNEALSYFEFLEIDLDILNPVKISEFVISTQKGHTIKSKLPLGGFGVSRYTLDNYLWQQAAKTGAQLLNDQVIEVHYKKDQFTIKTSTGIVLQSDYVLGAYGKRSILDKSLQRDFSFKKSPWLAVKAHYKANFPENTVALHNFEGGYCGLSKVENNRVNACYLVSYDSFKKYKAIETFQQKVMSKNQYLCDFFNEAELIFDKPITISQINFDKKKNIQNHIIMLGDAAGLIHPLCGNGMAMALKSSQIICELLIQNNSTIVAQARKKIENLYVQQWNLSFSKRLYAGRILQKTLLNTHLQTAAYFTASAIPSIVPKIIKQTHGEPIVCL
ncbi:NAD(P)/FAD-dependent oxidoreductase [Aquimarina sp. U1-2]|nr:NAD(P)/FAD-dependent oxidoreductase [Aquimarina sp. U1-2]